MASLSVEDVRRPESEGMMMATWRWAPGESSGEEDISIAVSLGFQVLEVERFR
jgi:hypothetical protein